LNCFYTDIKLLFSHASHHSHNLEYGSELAVSITTDVSTNVDTNVTTLSLNKCFEESTSQFAIDLGSADRFVAQLLQYLSNVVHLSLQHNTLLTGWGLLNLNPHTLTLDLSMCRRIESDTMIAILAPLQVLQSLAVYRWGAGNIYSNIVP
jgi:hypothetical protein